VANCRFASRTQTEEGRVSLLSQGQSLIGITKKSRTAVRPCDEVDASRSVETLVQSGKRIRFCKLTPDRRNVKRRSSSLMAMPAKTAGKRATSTGNMVPTEIGAVEWLNRAITSVIQPSLSQ
jgi:hypothetical protein